MSKKQAREPGEDDESEVKNLPAVAQQFEVLAPGNNVGDVLTQNLGGQQLSQFDLERIGVAAQGMPYFVAKHADEVEQVKEFDAILLLQSASRAFWHKSFEESGGGSLPDCKSEDLRMGMGTPDGPDMAVSQHACATCPHNQWGSGKNGIGKRCAETLALFVLRADKAHRKLPSVILIKPGSLRGIRDYMVAISADGFGYDGLVHHFSVVPDTSKTGVKYGRVKITRVAPIEFEVQAQVRSFANAIRPLIREVALPQHVEMAETSD